ncbi:uncharacterized protein HMPREF1541_10885 [Cyphellophora europaea CBS 101466]|uniref:Uncharacterized protein n=1 Tax=Cyphellophora europaea (strain CBS 101466) TaxID=1220924 RepID=W2S5Y3_CYPE1|nr:uncharacterized protein HMPREF1541_10885 [Cyphellophora europaea CBS 101466]ETN44020.1 hypothetical protein HMPREF1541_10885 [Cyphellophora europaea CBS 101466]
MASSATPLSDTNSHDDSTAAVLPFPVKSPGQSIAELDDPEHPEKDYGELAGFERKDEVATYVSQELHTPILEELYPRLWIVARKTSSNIDPLHLQIIKGRQILLTENPQLHLLWKYNYVYIKPLPEWLLDQRVWRQYLSPLDAGYHGHLGHADKGRNPGSPSAVHWPHQRQAATGFLRSYAFLVQHQSDFGIAIDHKLLPSSLDWRTWTRFIVHFKRKQDHEVSQRYQYGQLRLSRLHWAVRIFGPSTAPSRWFYYLPHWSTTPYLTSILAPLAFVFATLSVVLSAMQVVVGLPADALDLSGVDDAGLERMRQAFWVSSISLILAMLLVWTLAISIPFGVLLWQLRWGYANRNKDQSR